MLTKRLSISLALVCISILVLLSCAASTMQPTEAPFQGHKAILVDRAPNNDFWDYPNRVLLIDMDTGDLLAERSVAKNPALAISADGELIAAMSHFSDGIRWERSYRLQIFDSRNLKLIDEAYVPSDHLKSMRICDLGVIAFGDNNRCVVVPRYIAGSYGGPAKWTAFDLKAKGANMEGFYPVSTKWKECVGGTVARWPILGTSHWPLFDIYFAGLEEVHTFNFATGGNEKFSLLNEQEGGSDSCSDQQVSATPGLAFADREGRECFYVPKDGKPGRIKRINLSRRPLAFEKISSSTIASVNPSIHAICETRKRLFVATYVPPRSEKNTTEIRVFDSETLNELEPIDAGMPFSILDTSEDGSHLYVVGQSEIRVFDLARNELIRSITKVASRIGIFEYVPTRTKE